MNEMRSASLKTKKTSENETNSKVNQTKEGSNKIQ